jgi:RES domain-containing protein
MRIYRLGTRAFPVWDGSGAAAVGGRWNPVGVAVIYAAGSLALAMLERLVQRRNLGETLLVEASVPDDMAIEDMLASPPANWRGLGSPEAAAAGGEWVASRRTALLRVPSALVPREPNYLVNPAHPDVARISVGAPERLDWDSRLFGVPAPT